MMRRFIYSLFLFICVVCVLDIAIGSVADYMRSHARTGRTHKMMSALHEVTPDIMVMGSSRALHHYKPNVIERELGFSCYNAGAGGCGIIFAYPVFSHIRKRHTSQVLVYEFTPEYDVEEGDNLRYLSVIRQYFHDLNLEQLYSRISCKDMLKCYSSVYRYNGNILALLEDYIGQSPRYEGGFEPKYGNISEKARKCPVREANIALHDKLKVELLHKLCETAIADGTKVVLVRSPLYHGANPGNDMEAKEIARKYDITFIDYANDSRFLRNPEMFADTVHLNDQGAEAFSTVFSHDLKRLLQADSAQ